MYYPKYMPRKWIMSELVETKPKHLTATAVNKQLTTWYLTVQRDLFEYF